VTIIYILLYLLAIFFKPKGDENYSQSIFNPKIEVYQCKSGIIIQAVKNGISLCRTSDSLSLQSEGEQNKVMSKEIGDQQIVVAFNDPYLTIVGEKELLISKIYSQREVISILKEEKKIIPTGVLIAQRDNNLQVYFSEEIRADKATDIKTKVEFINFEKESIKERQSFSFIDFFKISEVFRNNDYDLLLINEAYPFIAPESGLLSLNSKEIIKIKCFGVLVTIPTINTSPVFYLPTDCDDYKVGYYYLNQNVLLRLNIMDIRTDNNPGKDTIFMVNDKDLIHFSGNEITQTIANTMTTSTRNIGLKYTLDMQVVGKGSIINPAGRSDYFDFAENNRFIYRLFL